MTFHRIASLLALIAVVCVLAVFFCHSIHGPYSAVHGPVTALLSVRAASGVRLTIVHAASNIPLFNFDPALVPLSFQETTIPTPDPLLPLASFDLALRC